MTLLLRRGEEGLTSTQVAVIMPGLLFWIMLTVQYGLWFHAKQVAGAAAAEAVDVAQVPDAPVARAEAAARSFLGQSGNLRNAQIEINRDTAQVTVRVRGQAPQLVPGMRWSVVSVAEAPIERFISQPQR